MVISTKNLTVKTTHHTCQRKRRKDNMLLVLAVFGVKALERAFHFLLCKVRRWSG